MNAKMIFDSVSYLLGKDDELKLNDCHIYDRSHDDEKWIRVDCGDAGSFDVGRMEGEEEYNIRLNEWIWVNGIKYKYVCASTTYAGYPILSVKEAYQIIKQHLR